MPGGFFICSGVAQELIIHFFTHGDVEAIRHFTESNTKPDFIAYEMPWVGRNAQVAIRLAHLCGAVVGLAVELGIPFFGIQPKEAKRALAGTGNALKEDMIRASRDRFGVEVDKDVADALGVALAACDMVSRIRV